MGEYRCAFSSPVGHWLFLYYAASYDIVSVVRNRRM